MRICCVSVLLQTVVDPSIFSQKPLQRVSAFIVPGSRPVAHEIKGCHFPLLEPPSASVICHLRLCVVLEVLTVQEDQAIAVATILGLASTSLPPDSCSHPGTVILLGFGVGHLLGQLLRPDRADAVVVVLSLEHTHLVTCSDASPWGFATPRVECDHYGVAAAVATGGAACLGSFGVAARDTALNRPEWG